MFHVAGYNTFLSRSMFLKNADIIVSENMFNSISKMYAYPSVLKVDQQLFFHHNTNKNQPFWSGK